jgi:hypothetical protein
MRKVIIDREDVLIQNVSALTYIPDVYNFDFSSKWVANNSPTKRIAIRKIKIFPMTFTSIAIFSFDNPNIPNTRVSDVIAFTLRGESITKYLDYMVRKMNSSLELYYPNDNYSITCYIIILLSY